MKFHRGLLRVVLLVVTVCGAAWAQDTGSITGTVKDPSGAASELREVAQIRDVDQERKGDAMDLPEDRIEPQYFISEIPGAGTSEQRREGGQMRVGRRRQDQAPSTDHDGGGPEPDEFVRTRR